MAGKSKVNPQDVRSRLTAQDALQLRAKGLNFEQIGKRLGCHKSTAWRAVVSAMAAVACQNRESADKILQRELAITETVLDALMAALEDGDISAAGQIVKVLSRRARYLGLDAPVKHENLLLAPEPVLTTEQLRGELLGELTKLQASRKTSREGNSK